MISRAIKHGKLDTNPILRVKKLPENNVRERVLDSDGFEALLEACPQHLRPIVLVAYYTGMRKSEIVFLTWEEVDLQNRFIRLKGDRTKTGVARVCSSPSTSLGSALTVAERYQVKPGLPVERKACG